MSYDDKQFMNRGFRVRHKYRRKHGCHAVCERCGVKRRKTSSGWEYQIPPERLGMKSWTSSNPPCVKREPEPEPEPRKPEPFMAKAELTNDDLNVLSYFFHFVGPWVDRATAGFHDPEVAEHPKLVENWRKFADILKRLHDSTGAEEYLASLSLKERRALGKKIARAAAARRTGT